MSDYEENAVSPEYADDMLAQIAEANQEAVVILRRVELILEEISVASGVIAYRSLPWYAKLRTAWHHAADVIKQSAKMPDGWECYCGDSTQEHYSGKTSHQFH